MSNADKLLKMAGDFEKLATYGDRKSFIERLAQEFSPVERVSDSGPKGDSYPPPPPMGDPDKQMQQKMQKGQPKPPVQQSPQASPFQQKFIATFNNVNKAIKSGTTPNFKEVIELRKMYNDLISQKQEASFPQAIEAAKVLPLAEKQVNLA